MRAALAPSGAAAPVALSALLAVVLVGSASVGAVQLAPAAMAGMLAAAAGLPVDGGWAPLDQTVFFTLRLPRVLMAAVVGACCAASGALTQGLFRNPLADPGLVGVTGGAAVGAAAALALGAAAWSPLAVAGAAGLGALLVTVAVVSLAAIDGRPSVGQLLLAGVAMQAMAGAALGLLLTVADDAGLRSITFWMMGSVGGATWPSLAVVTGVAAIGLAWSARLSPSLDVLLLGDDAARDLGVDPVRLQRAVVGLVAAMVGASTAFCGTIGFVGLVVPHLARGLVGPRHARLVPASALGGASLLAAADTLARTVAAPAELPVGLLTTLVGGPFFLFLLRRGR
jgi:iron complex transport system permease protein